MSDRLSETVFLVQFKSKDPNRAYSVLHDHYHIPLLNFTFKMIDNLPEAEDIVSEILIKCFLKRMDFFSVPALRTFLWIACRNASISYIRKRDGHDDKEKDIIAAMSSESLFEQEFERMYILELLYKAMGELGDTCCSVCRMKYFEGSGNAEIAEQLKISVHTVNAHIQKCKNFLKKNFKID